MTGLSLADYEQRARLALLQAPGKRLAQINLEFHQEDDCFWSSFSSWLGGKIPGHEAPEAAKESYLTSFVEMAKKQPALWVRLRQSLDASASRLSVPNESTLTLSQLNRDDGASGRWAWHSFLSGFRLHNDVNDCEIKQYLAADNDGWLNDYASSLGWLQALATRKVIGISDRALYVVLAHGVCEAFRTGSDNPRWLKHLNNIPQDMRHHTSLGLLRIFPAGRAWCADNAKAPIADQLAPLGDEQKGIGGLFWMRNYSTHSEWLNDQLAKSYLCDIDPIVFMEKTLSLGSMRIAPAAMPTIATIFQKNGDAFYSLTLTEKNINDLTRIGVSQDLIAGHPCVTSSQRAVMIRKELGL